MYENCRNIYQFARNTTTYTQEVAAKELNISVRSLIHYETDRTIPHGDIVANMVEIYGTRWLGYEHLRKSTRLGMEVLPGIDFSDIAKSVLVLQKESSDVEKIRNCMVEIACDGRVDLHEEDRWHRVTKEVKEMAGAALSVVFSR